MTGNTEDGSEDRDSPERAFMRKQNGKVYRHHKGKTYMTTGCARSEATGELLVLYKEANRATRYYECAWVQYARPFSEFSDRIEGVLRFRLLEGEELEQANREFMAL